MCSLSAASDDQAAAELLWQMKRIATKEVLEELRPMNRTISFALSTTDSVCSSQDSSEELADLMHYPMGKRTRTVSFGSVDTASSASSPTSSTMSLLDTPRPSPSNKRIDNQEDTLQHFDWSHRVVSTPEVISSPLRTSTKSPQGGELVKVTRNSKRKRESFVGTSTKSGVVRATLRKKFSWKQYPEVRNDVRSAQTNQSCL